MRWKRVLAVLAFIFRPLLKIMTPKIEEALEKFVLDLYRKALETDNPVDDLVVGFLLDILDIERPE